MSFLFSTSIADQHICSILQNLYYKITQNAADFLTVYLLYSPLFLPLVISNTVITSKEKTEPI